MSMTRHFVITLAIAATALVAIASAATWSSAATPDRPAPPPVATRRAAARGPEASKSPDRLPITFFVATGPCGSGCDGWIAAEGRIDADASGRLRKLLGRLGERKLQLFLNSPGGSVMGAIELGRLIRSRGLAVSVARTLPAGCRDDGQDSKACDALKRSGQDLASALDASGVMCNSACVLVLASGTRRTVPPGVRLAVHAIGVDARKNLSPPLVAAATRIGNAKIVDFLHDMGTPKALFDAANVVPHESSRVLGRDDLVRFGLDTREFAEAEWRFREQPFVAMTKTFFLHTGEAGIAYPEGLVQLNCGAAKSVRLTFARERAAVTSDSARPVRLAIAGQRIDVPYLRRAGTIDIHSTSLSPDAIAATPDDTALEVSSDGVTADGKARPPVVLTMTGFSAAYARLRQACADTMRADTTCSPGAPATRCAGAE